MKDSFIKRRYDKHFLKRWVPGLGSTWTLTKSNLCGTCAGEKKCASVLFHWGKQMSTFHFNPRCKQNYLEDTSGPGIHQRTHLGAPFSLKTTWTSTTSGSKDPLVLFNDIIDRQDLFFYYLRGYAFDITAQQTQVLVDWLGFFFVVWVQNRWAIGEFETLLIWQRIIQLYSPIDRHFQCCSADRIFS